VRLFADLIEDATRLRVVARKLSTALLKLGTRTLSPGPDLIPVLKENDKDRSQIRLSGSTACRMRRPSRATSVLLHTGSFAGRGTSLRKLPVVCTRKVEILLVPRQTQSSSGSVGGLRSFRNCSALIAAGIV
jgi:hypothetical protein